MILVHHFFIAALCVALVGCATQPISSTTTTQQHAAENQQHLASLAKIQAFSLKGRLGVVTQKQGFSGSIEWQHHASADNIDVYSPVGGKVANIAKNTSGVTLTDQKGHSIQANNAEELTETTLGFRLPLTGLSDWAIGRPTASKIETISWDAQGRLTLLKQDGWDISFENYIKSNDNFLPSKITLKSEKVNLKLLVENWLNTP